MKALGHKYKRLTLGQSITASMTDEERDAELVRLKGLLSASERAGAGYGRRMERIKARIAELQDD